MQWLAVLCDGVQGLKGGEILSAIYCYWQSGNQCVKAMMRSILEEVAVPMLQMIKGWMLEGELVDTFHEFFILPNYAIDKKKMWVGMFKINPEMVPCFFSVKLVSTILVTGKSLYFLRKECEEEDWSESTPSCDSVLDLEKARWVTWVSQSTNEKLLNILFVKYRLQEHCMSIKKYLLMAQGDFHQALIEGMHLILNQPAVRIYKHTLVSILENAIKSSNCQFHDPEFTSRLKITLEDTRVEQGWDIFTLDYTIGPPLNTFFPGELMMAYRRIFKFLWKVKRAHYLMYSSQHNRNLILLQSMTDVLPQLRRMFLIGNQISHFVNTLSNYLMVESIEAPWEGFYKKLGNVVDLDELIRIHDKFVMNVQENCFFTVEAIHKKVNRILDIIIRYHHSREVFIASVVEEYRARTAPLSEILAGDGISLISSESFMDISNISEAFPDEVIGFNELLSENDNLKLKKLVFILDFNEFYDYETLRKRGFYEDEPEYSNYDNSIRGKVTKRQR